MNLKPLHELPDDELGAEMRRMFRPLEDLPPPPDTVGTRQRLMAAAEQLQELTPEQQAAADRLLPKRRRLGQDSWARTMSSEKHGGKFVSAVLLSVTLVILGGLFITRYPDALPRTVGAVISALWRRPYRIAKVDCDSLVLQFFTAERQSAAITVYLGPAPWESVLPKGEGEYEVLSRSEGRWPTATGLNTYRIEGNGTRPLVGSFTCDGPSPTQSP